MFSVAIEMVQPTGPAPEALLLKPGDKVSFMGDSITDLGGYVHLVAYVLKTAYPELNLPQFVNAGIGGQRAEHMVPRFEKDMKLADNPKWVFISVGINDVNSGLGKPHDPEVLGMYEKNVAKMVDKALAAGANTVLLTPTIIGESQYSEGNIRLSLYVDAMKRVAAAKKCMLVDLHSMFLQALAKKSTNIKLTSDGIHMEPYGDVIMAIGVLRAMGVPDAGMSAINPETSLNIRLNMPLNRLAEHLQVPISKLLSISEAVYSF
jgi:lysophospholipase L1-like esterase